MGMTKYVKQYTCTHNIARDGNRYPTETIWRCCFQCVSELLTDVDGTSLTPLSLAVAKLQLKFGWSESTARRAIERLVDANRLVATQRGKRWLISVKGR